ncbi:MAG: hypothetical protein JWL77_5547 [Chthonomonadaceae bacterium]|nr:hypothetical protein [Chthonomonadaceae bacterium]
MADPYGILLSSEDKRSEYLVVRAEKWGSMVAVIPADHRPTTRLTIRLPFPNALHVSCTDSLGKPLPHTPLRVASIGDVRLPVGIHARWEQQTDAKGDCVFPDLPQGWPIRLAPAKEKVVDSVGGDHITLNATTLQQVSLRLTPGAAVSGKILSAQNGTPAAGIRVGAYAVGGIKAGEALSDSRGHYRISGLHAGLYNLIPLLTDVQAEKMTARALEKIDVQAGATLADRNLTLVPGALITGKVTDQSTGKPVAGVTIYLSGPANPRSGGPSQIVMTGEDGVYRARVPAGSQSVNPILFTSSINRYERYAPAATVTVAENAVLTQNFTLKPPPSSPFFGPISVRVVGPDDKPVPYASLTIEPTIDSIEGPESRPGEQAFVDADGAFTFVMLRGSARMRARSGLLATETATVTRNSTQVTLHLRPNVLLTLSGQVVDAQNAPIEGAKVSLLEVRKDGKMEGNWLRADTETDAQGRFAFAGLYPDLHYALSAEADGYGFRTTADALYHAGERVSPIILPLPTADRTVTGRVVDQNGVPVANTQVLLMGDNTRGTDIFTDAQGHFHFDNVVDEAVTLILVGNPRERGYALMQKAHAGDREVLLVLKSPGASASASGRKQP